MSITMIMVMVMVVLGVSYSAFVITTEKYKASEILEVSIDKFFD